MTESESVSSRRAQLLKRLFPNGVPMLWCPSLTHYDEDGRIDEGRITSHLRHLSAHVKGFLIPGSTGDGWDLSQDEIRQLLQIAFDQAQALEIHLLIGILKSDAPEAIEMIEETVQWLKAHTGETEVARALSAARVCGFTVCAPRGNALGQDQIQRALSSILELGLPMALYQLPQVTQNEISPEVVEHLASRYENFVLFKDSSGADRVVT